MKNKKEYVEPKVKTVEIKLQKTIICGSDGDLNGEVGLAPHEQNPIA